MGWEVSNGEGVGEGEGEDMDLDDMSATCMIWYRVSLMPVGLNDMRCDSPGDVWSLRGGCGCSMFAVLIDSR